MKALILNDKVVQIKAEEFEVAAQLTWVECDDSVKQGWYYIDGEFKASDKSDSEQLQEAKDIKISGIRAPRNDFMYQDVTYNGSVFFNTPTSGNNLISEIALGTPSINWLDTSNDLVVLSDVEAKELAALMKDKRSNGYFEEARLIKEINDCTTVEEVQSIAVNFS
jgi:hypothetical protein